MISKQTIDKIFSAVRVEEVVGEYVQLKRAGSNLKGLSPFKEEKTPSFIVSPSKQIWKDFSTGKGGNAISFIMELEGFTYPEALRYLARKYGIEVEDDEREYTEEEKKAQTDKELLYKIHEVANDFFQEQLWEAEEGKLIGLSYLKERDIREDIIRKFHLGYSPEKRDAFTSYALSKGYSKDILEKSGLSLFKENTSEGVDRFRERVIFPIHGYSGRVLAFGGRILKNNVKLAKYLNSPETEIYHKSNVLYGLFQSKQAISRENLCLLVEGYMDVIALHQCGIENVVASSGTALTIEQIKLIKRLTENVTVLFDGDSAGIKASFRSIDLLLAEGMNIRVLLFPDGDDPDSFSRKHPRDYVEDFIKNQAQDFIDFKAKILLDEARQDPIQKAEAIRDIVKSISQVKNPLKQEIYVKEVASKFSLSEQSLFSEINLQRQGSTFQKNPPAVKPTAPKLEVVKSNVIEETPLQLLEEKLVQLMLKYGDKIVKRTDAEGNAYEITVIEEILGHLEEDDYTIQSEINFIIVEEIRKGLEQNELRTGTYFVNSLDEKISKKVADSFVNQYEMSNWSKYNIYFSTEEDMVARIVNDVIIRHKREYVMKLIQDLKEELKENPEPMPLLEKIMKLNELRIMIDQELNRVV